MAKKGENTKKAAGNAQKAEVASKKKQAEAQRQEQDEELKWQEGGKKGNKKKEDETFKREEAARKKAERDALLKAEEALLPTKPVKAKQRGAEKVANKRAGKIDDFLGNGDEPELLSARGLDEALDAIALTSRNAGVSEKDLDKHPERRVKAALKEFEDRRIPELRKEQPGLRLQQIRNIVYKEFKDLPENPMNRDNSLSYNATKEDQAAKLAEMRQTRAEKFH